MNPVTGEHAAVRFERTLPAPPHRVYRAWLDPALIGRWMAPGGYEATRVEVDERVGGSYRIWQEDGAGVPVGGFECRIVELVPDERIVWRWGFAGPDRTDGPVFDSRLTVTLRATEHGTTLLTFVHEQLDALADALPQVAEQVANGWDDVLTRLAAVLA